MPFSVTSALLIDTLASSGCVVEHGVQTGAGSPPSPVMTTELPTMPCASMSTPASYVTWYVPGSVLDGRLHTSGLLLLQVNAPAVTVPSVRPASSVSVSTRSVVSGASVTTAVSV